MKTLQETYSFIRNHLLTQKCQSVKYEYDIMSCLYHGPRSLSCAVGCLIPRDLDTSSIENRSMENAEVRGYLANIGAIPKDSEAAASYIEMLAMLQFLHDEEMPQYKKEWRDYEEKVIEELDKVAKRFDLQPE